MRTRSEHHRYRRRSNLRWLVVALTSAAAIGCASDNEDATQADLSATAGPTEDADSVDSVSALDVSDVELSGPEVDVVGLVLDTEALCVEDTPTVLGQGDLEPPIFVPRCLIHDATGTRYIVRPGSRAVPTDYTECDLGDSYGWRMCGQECVPNEDARITLDFEQCDSFAVPHCATLGGQDAARQYRHPFTYATVTAHNVTLEPPWSRDLDAHRPSFFEDYRPVEEPCRESIAP